MTTSDDGKIERACRTTCGQLHALDGHGSVIRLNGIYKVSLTLGDQLSVNFQVTCHRLRSYSCIVTLSVGKTKILVQILRPSFVRNVLTGMPRYFSHLLVI